jgi:hypothetical protein
MHHAVIMGSSAVVADLDSLVAVVATPSILQVLAASVGPGVNERFTRSANRRHASGVNRSTGPVRSLVSRTST